MERKKDNNYSVFSFLILVDEWDTLDKGVRCYRYGYSESDKVAFLVRDEQLEEEYLSGELMEKRASNSKNSLYTKQLYVPHDKIEFDYINWRGEKGKRKIEIGEMYFGSTEYHPENQWLLEGYDLDKQENRIFAMKNMTDVVKIEVEKNKSKWERPQMTVGTLNETEAALRLRDLIINNLGKRKGE